MTSPVHSEARPLEVPANLARIHRSLRRARRVLWQTQRPDGAWESMGELGPTPTAQVLVSLHYLGKLGGEDGTEAARWLRSQQRRDGSFVAYPFSTSGDVGATASAMAALHVSAPGESAEAISRARRWLDARGGTKRILEGMETGDVSALYLAMAGLLDPKLLPCPTALFSLVPPVVRGLQTRFHSGVLMMALQLNVLVRRLRGDFGPDGKDIGFIARAECRETVELLETFQNQDGSWNANTVQQALALPALVACGLPLEDERIVRGLRWMETQKIRDAQGLRYAVFGSAVWSTAFDLRALLATGVPAGDPRVVRGLEWLIDSQLEVPMPKVDNRKPGAILTGGWGFQRGNHTMADCDDVGVVFSAFGPALAEQGECELDPALKKRLRESVEKGRDWLLGMQNPDGGWSAFVWNLPPKKPGPAMMETVRAKLDDPLAMARFLFEPQVALGDPSTEDLTSRVLHGLGSIGFTVQSPEIARAVEFLKRQQCDHGGFWGRWTVNYLAATSFVLMGLRAVGVNMKEEWVQRATRWMLSKQNPDGGWGEGVESYRDPSRAGLGPSMAPLTGLVLQGLIDAGEGDSKAVERGVEFLLRRQAPDGTWPNDDYLHANVPPDTYYLLPEAAKYYPTEALAKYLTFKKHPPAPAPERWSDSQLDAARQRTDLLAEKVVSSIFARGDLAAVNELLGTMFRSDAPIPEGLPPEAREYFEATDALPVWADPEQIRIAQRLFSRAGWEVAMSLFCSSLPQAYAAARGAHVLTQTKGMTKQVRQRIFETAQFIFDVLDEGQLAKSGRGIRTAQKIRLMHAAIRHLLLSRPTPQWDGAGLGLPINQEDLAGTLLTFSIVTVDGIRKLGVAVSEEEQRAWVHTWNTVGAVLGIDEELFARDPADARALMDRIRERQWARSTDGRALIQPLVELMQHFIPGVVFDGIPVALVRHLAGDHCGDLLGLPPTDWTRIFIDAAEIADPLVDLGVRQLGLEKVLSLVRQAMMHAFVNIEREGKAVRFRIPTSLQHTLDPD